MRVIVTGAVAWTDEAAIRNALEQLPKDSVIIHGDCDGADEIAGRIGVELGLHVEAMAKNDSDYRRYRRGAWKGLNERMLATGADLVLVFHPDLAQSQGAKHMIHIAEAAGVNWREPPLDEFH